MRHVIKRSNWLKCGSLSLASEHLTYFGVHGSSAGGNLMYLSCDLACSMSPPVKSCDQKRCNSGDMLFLVTCHEHMFKELCEFMGGSPSH